MQVCLESAALSLVVVNFRFVDQILSDRTQHGQVIDNWRTFADHQRLAFTDGLALGADDVAELRRQLGVAPGDRQMILIGLDGGIKRRGELDTELQAVFGQIDGMPMRRQELRERGRLTSDQRQCAARPAAFQPGDG